MKFTKLSTKFNNILKKKKKGKTINPEKIQKLRHILNEKKSHYEERLKTDISSEKRDSLESKLKVVTAQIQKSEALLSAQSVVPENKEQPAEPATEEQPAEPATEEKPAEPVKES